MLIELRSVPVRCVARALGAATGLALALSLLGVPDAAAEDLTRGREIFQLCGTCHGESGQGNQRYSAPAIGGLPQWYVERQLMNLKQGVRAYRAEDTAGLQMRPMARALTTEADVKAVAAYVASLKPAPPTPTLTGQATHGWPTYTACSACHGDHAQGNEAIGAPPLARQADWYLVTQLTKFRRGLRGTQPNDAKGTQMRPMAMTLPSEQAILDVVAYIGTLRGPAR